MLARRPIRVIAWKEPRLLYIRVPKSANTSIRHALPGGIQRRLYLRSPKSRFPRHLAFSFVRNPWARLVSIYAEKIWQDERTDQWFDRGVHRCFRRLDLPLRAGMPFQEFAELTCGLPDEKTEKHLRSQSWFIVREGELLPEFLGRVETIGEDWQRLGRTVGVEIPLPHRNQSTHAHYTSFYDAPLRKLVADRYHEDIERFAYDFA